jgi:hypothetical protein
VNGNFACVPYTSDQKKDFFDGAIKAARGFAILANISIGAGVLVLLTSSCAYFEILLLRSCGWLFIVGCVFEMLTLTFLASKVLGRDPFNASIWWGAGLSIVASLTALITGVLTIRLSESKYEPEKNAPPRPIMVGESNARKTNGTSKAPEDEEQARTMRPGIESTSEIILPDGRRQYTTTKWNKDGTRTVTEEIV